MKNILGLLFDGLEATQIVDEPDVSDAEWMYGVFIDDENTPVAIIGCEKKVAVYMGAAMTMMAPAVAHELADSGDISAMINDSICEVMNIMSRLFMSQGTGHLRFGKLESYSTLPTEIECLLNTADKKSVYQISVKKYGEGILKYFTN
ncbi:MAG TPA: hypothetical protein DCF62_08855 [Porticoccaceae bacterium]|nr:hypothetical protein [Porticoccaceae bacterium]